MPTYLEKVEAMAFKRAKWIAAVRNSLGGALREFAKLRYAELISYPYDWEPEVKRLIQDIQKLFDPSFVQTSFADRDTAFREAFREASIGQAKVTYARNKFESTYLEKKDVKRFMRLAAEHHDDFSAEKLLRDMLARHAPEMFQLLEKK